MISASNVKIIFSHVVAKFYILAYRWQLKFLNFFKVLLALLFSEEDSRDSNGFYFFTATPSAALKQDPNFFTSSPTIEFIFDFTFDVNLVW